MTTRIKLRRDTAANWFDANPILSAGEPGLETDTRQIKYGDGVTAWRDLDYSNNTIKSMAPVTVTTQDPHIWVNRIGKPRNAMSAQNVAYDSQGNVIVSSTAWNGSPGSTDGKEVVNLSKFDTAGNTLWSHDIPGYTNTYPGGVCVDTDDNIYVVVNIWYPDGNTTSAAVVKVDADGVFMWNEAIYGGNGSNTEIYAIAVGPDSNPVVTGTVYTGDNTNAFVAKFNSTTGAVMHSTQWDDGEYDDERSNGIAVDQNNNVVLVGNIYDDQLDANVVTIHKVNHNLASIWTKKISTVKSNRESGYKDAGGSDVKFDASGNMYIVGYFYSYRNAFGDTSHTSVVVMKLNADGIVQWSRDIKGECDSVGAGIAIGSNGRIYVSALTFVREYDEQNVFRINRGTTAIACYEPASGEVLWQRYLETPQLTDGGPSYSVNAPYEFVSGSCIASVGDKIAVVGTFAVVAKEGAFNGRVYGDPQAWVAQLPASGELVDVSGWKLVESRIPGRFQSFASEDWDSQFNVFTFVLDYGNEANLEYLSGSAIEITQLFQDSNTWKFGTNGDLTLPSAGNLDIGKKQVGWVNIHGHRLNNDYNVKFQSICVDPMGNSYAFGYDGYDDNPYVVKYNTDGGIEWQKLMWYSPQDNRNQVYGNAEAGAYDTTTGQLVIVVTDYDNSRTLLVRLNAQTGDVVSSQAITMGDQNFYAYDLQLKSDGTPVLVGNVNQGVKNYDVAVLRGGIDGYEYSWFEMDTTLFGSDVPLYNQQNNWLVSGTSVDGEQYCDFINRYEPITATPVPGTGATFDITVANSAYSAIAVNAGGTGFKANDRITIPGTSLGGATTDNDLTINVDSVDGDVIIAVSIVSGTALPLTHDYTNISGASQGGSSGNGAVFTVNVVNDVYTAATATTPGTGYAVNDTIVVAGSALSGVDTTNDLTITVTAIDGDGGVTSATVSGTAAGRSASYTAVAGVTETGYGAVWYVDKYDDSGPVYYIGYNLNGYGYRVGDRLVVLGSVLGGTNGTNDLTITVTSVDGSGAINGYSFTGVANLGTVRFRFTLNPDVDFGNTSNGRAWKIGIEQGNDAVVWTPTWQHQFGYDGTGQDRATSVALTSANEVYVAGHSYTTRNYSGDYPFAWVSKFNSAGALQWTYSFYDEAAPQDSSHVAVDSEGNVIVCFGDYEYGRTVVKLDPNGAIMWRAMPDYNGDYYPYDGSVSVDSDDNIIITGSDDWSQWFITKLDEGGQLQFNHRLTTGFDSYQQSENNGTRWTAVQGDYFYTGGTTYAFADGNYNGFIAKLPLDGTGLDGVKDWAYDEVQVQFSHTNNPGYEGIITGFGIHASEGIVVAATDPAVITVPEVTYDTYQSPVFNADGGAIVFGDGSVQSTSAGVLQQRLVNSYNNNSNLQSLYHIRASDAGRHILLTGYQNLWLPAATEVDFPVGTVLTIVNWSGNSKYLYYNSGNGYNDWGQTTYISISGSNNTEYNNCYLEIPSYNGGNIVTLIKVREDDDSDYGGSSGYKMSWWIASGSNLSFTD